MSAKRIPVPATLVRATGIALALLAVAGVSGIQMPAAAAGTLEVIGADHLSLTVVGLAPGQTARISVTNSPDPGSPDRPTPLVAEMMFHDSHGNVIVDRAGRPVERTVTIDPHTSESLDLNGNALAGPGGRVTIVPCLRVVSIAAGSLAVPTVELYNNLVKTTTALGTGVLKGFDSQPDPSIAPEAAFGTVGLTQGVTARLNVRNTPPDPTRTADPPGPITLEITIHDAGGKILVDRFGREVRKIATVEPGRTTFLELNGNDVAAAATRVGIVPCLKVLAGSRGSHVAATLETYINLVGHTLTFANWSGPTDPVIPAPR
jgi:hypothetical protein